MKIESIEIFLYKRHVDEINIVARIRKSEGEAERKVGRVKCGAWQCFRGQEMVQIQALNLRFTKQTQNGKMPLLDVKVWKEEREEKKMNEAREIEVMEDESAIAKEKVVPCMRTTEKKWLVR